MAGFTPEASSPARGRARRVMPESMKGRSAMGSQSEMVRLVGEVTDRYGSLDAFFARLRAEFDDRPTMRLPVVRAVASEPVAWSAVPQHDPDPAPRPQVRTPPAEAPSDEIESSRGEFVAAPVRAAAGMWGRLTRLLR